MKTMKLAALALALGGIALSAAPAQADPHHKRQVCSVKWVHHHKVRHCYWR